MGTFFYIFLGVFATMAVLYLYHKHKQHPVSIRGWIFAGIAIVLIVFGLSWAQVSLHENELQAAIMGIVVFSGTGVLVGFLTWREIGSHTEGKPKSTDNVETTSMISSASITAAIMFLLFALLFPTALLLKSAGKVVFNVEKTESFVVSTIVSDKALPRTIEKGVVYQTLYGSDFMNLDQRVMLGIISSIDASEWVEFFNMTAPEKDRVAITREGVQAFHNWLDSENIFPHLELQTESYISNIKKNAEEIILWIYRATLFPPCEETVLQQYDRGIFSDNVQDLIGCKPPEKYRKHIAPHAADLLLNLIDSTDIPHVIRIQDTMPEAIDSIQIQAHKKQIRALRTVTGYLWLLPVGFLLIGIVIIVISGNILPRFLWWSSTLAGINCLILVKLLSQPEKTFAMLLADLSAILPPPVLAIVHNATTGLFQQLASPVSYTMYFFFISGLLLFIITYWKKLSVRFQK